MSKHHQYPASYDDLVRQDVPLPDTSYRPSRAEVARAHLRGTGPSIVMDSEDTAVRAALMSLDGADLSDLRVEIDDGRAILGGSVATSEDRRRIVAAIEMVPGIAAVIDTIRVRL